MRSFSEDDRTPFALSDWKVSAGEALKIALANGGRQYINAGGHQGGIQLYQAQDHILVLDFGFSNGPSILDIRVNATNGQIIKKNEATPTL